MEIGIIYKIEGSLDRQASFYSFQDWKEVFNINSAITMEIGIT